MIKTYTGIELLQAIEESKIKEGTKFIDNYNCSYIYKLDGIEGDLTLYKQEQYYDDSIPDYSVFVDNVFTVVEEDDIDIQSIEELDYYTDIMESNYEQSVLLNMIRTNKQTINQLTKAVKQLDKQINN